jgi:hypothetical protein
MGLLAGREGPFAARPPARHRDFCLLTFAFCLLIFFYLQLAAL